MSNILGTGFVLSLIMAPYSLVVQDNSQVVIHNCKSFQKPKSVVSGCGYCMWYLVDADSGYVIA